MKIDEFLKNPQGKGAIIPGREQILTGRLRHLHGIEGVPGRQNLAGMGSGAEVPSGICFGRKAGGTEGSCSAALLPPVSV